MQRRWGCFGSLNLLPQCHIFIYIYQKKKAECTKEKHTTKHRVTKKKKEIQTEKNRGQHQAEKRKREEHTKTWKKFQQ